MYELKYLFPHKGPLSKILFEQGLIEFDYSNPNICYGGKGGGGQNTVQTNSAPPQFIQDAYNSLLARGNQVANQPLQQYQGNVVAGFTPDQTTAMNTVNQAQGIATPFENAGAQYATAGAAPVWGNLPQVNQQTISQYESPYNQDVINATTKQFQQNDAQQQSQLLGNAIQSGASPFGGDRAGVAAATLAGQQDLANNQTVASLNNQNYSQALNEANAQQQLQANTQASDAWRQLSAGQLLPQIGTTAQSNTLNGASAQLQSGALQQQLSQEQLNVPYEQFLQQQAYPFQTTQFLGGLTEALGGASGGTSSTTTPGPSTASQLGGLGLTGFALNQSLPAGYGLMSLLGGLKKGGIVPHRASGGAMGVPQIGPDNQVHFMNGTGNATLTPPSGIAGTAAPQVNMMPSGASSVPANLTQNYGLPPSAPTSAVPLSGIAPQVATAPSVAPDISYNRQGNVGGVTYNWQGNANTAYNRQGNPIVSAHGGRIANFDAGGIIPDISVSYVPEMQMSGGRNTIPQPPKPASDNNSPSPLSSLASGANLGKLLSMNMGKPDNSLGISGENAGGSSTLDPGSGSALDMGGESNPLDFSSSGPFKTGGIAHKSFGGGVLPIVGDIAGAFFGDPMAGNQMQMGMNLLDKLKLGGSPNCYDNGGMITSPAQAALAGSNPTTQQQASQYDNMPIDKLQQLAVMQPNNPLIQKALQQKKMGGGSSQGIAGGNTPMYGGYAAGGIPHFDDGGDTPAQQVLEDIANDVPTPPDASGIAPPVHVKTDNSQTMPQPENENLDAKPVIDHSGDTIKIHYPSEKTSLDTGIPSMKDTGVTSSAWEPLLAAGLGMMAGNSPHALVNVGRGGLEGLQAAEQQRTAALKENQAQTEAQKLQDDLDFRNKQLAQTGEYQKGELENTKALRDIENKKLTTLTPYEQAQLGLEKQKVDQGKWLPVKDIWGNESFYNPFTKQYAAVPQTGGGMTRAFAPSPSAPPAPVFNFNDPSAWGIK